MATVYQQFQPEEAQFLATDFPQILKNNGTNFPVSGLGYDAATGTAAFWTLRSVNYASGNVEVDIDWYADTAANGSVVWGAALSVLTPNTDSQDIETDTFATETTLTDTHLTTTAQRLHRAVLTITSLDSLAADDYVTLRLRRLGSDSSDTMAGDAILTLATARYSDT